MQKRKSEEQIFHDILINEANWNIPRKVCTKMSYQEFCKYIRDMGVVSKTILQVNHDVILDQPIDMTRILVYTESTNGTVVRFCLG